jgi:mRNA interferase MazF
VKKGDIWVVTIPVTDGHEQYGTRPVIVLADTPSSIVVGIPCTTNIRALRFPYTVSMTASAHNGLTDDSIALVLQIRAIDKKRLHQKVGSVEKEVLQKIEGELRRRLGL